MIIIQLIYPKNLHTVLMVIANICKKEVVAQTRLTYLDGSSLFMSFMFSGMMVVALGNWLYGLGS